MALQQDVIINARCNSDSLLYLRRCIRLTCQACEHLIDVATPLPTRRGTSSAQEHDALRELSLSLAAVETLLVDFCCEILQHAGEDPRPYIGGPVSALLAPLATLDRGGVGVGGSNSDTGRGKGTSHPLPPGGTVSLLYHMSCCLEDTLESLASLAAPLSLWAVACQGVQAVRKGGKGIAVQDLWARAATPLDRALTRFVLGRPLWESPSTSLARATCELNTLIRLHVLTVHHLHKQALWEGGRDKKGAGRGGDRSANIPAAESHPVLLMRRPTELSLPGPGHEGGHEGWRVDPLPVEALGPITEGVGRADESISYARRALTSTSMPRSASLWPTRSLPNALLSRALDTYYAAFAWSVAWERGGRWRAYLTVPIFFLAYLLYSIFPLAARDATTTLLAQPDPAFMAKAWRATGRVGNMAARVRRWMKAVPGRKAEKPLAVDQAGVLLAGVPCHVLSNVHLDLRALASLHAVQGQAWPQDKREYALPQRGRGVSIDAPNTDRSPGASDSFLSARGQGLSSHSHTSGTGTGAGGGGFPLSTADPIEQETDSEGDSAVGLPVSPPSTTPPAASPAPCPLPPVVLAIHGGGFIGRTGGDIGGLAAWVQASATPVMVIQPHYSLSPESRFPVALQEVMSVYRLIRAHTPAVVLLGESAGGMLAAALTVWAISSRIPLPRAVAMVYPSLNIGLQASPSRALHMADPLISYPVLNALAGAYLPVGTPLVERVRHPLLAPLHAPDSILQHFPPCYMLTGGLDPLLDDSCDMYLRLVKAGRAGVELDIIRAAPHGFLAFPFLQGAKEGIQAIHTMLSHAVAHIE